MEKISGDLFRGYGALFSLKQMIEHAITGAGYKPEQPFFEEEWVGLYFDNGKFWIGVRLENPSLLSFEADSPEGWETISTCPFDGDNGLLNLPWADQQKTAICNFVRHTVSTYLRRAHNTAGT